MRHSPAAVVHLPSAPRGWFAFGVPEALVAVTAALIVASWADAWWAGLAVLIGALVVTGVFAARRGSTQVIALLTGWVTSLVGFYAALFLIAGFLLAHYRV
ncbi:MAG TPA: hypothetical protein VMH41_14065 [Mycobacteriales bacterium]|nr:hypothetical protein [Mycobacteriales bacterium]